MSIIAMAGAIKDAAEREGRVPHTLPYCSFESTVNRMTRGIEAASVRKDLPLE